MWYNILKYCIYIYVKSGCTLLALFKTIIKSQKRKSTLYFAGPAIGPTSFPKEFVLKDGALVEYYSQRLQHTLHRAGQRHANFAAARLGLLYRGMEPDYYCI